MFVSPSSDVHFDRVVHSKILLFYSLLLVECGKELSVSPVCGIPRCQISDSLLMRAYCAAHASGMLFYTQRIGLLHASTMGT
eukprot:m.1644029 g.1644029  ORF g.1644029 m.1644029 type:complete len:82 (+) comp60853_c0_seq1:259-504(+)